MADSPQNPQMGPGKGLSKGKSNPGELLKIPSQSGDTLGNSGNKPDDKVDFLLPPKVPGDMGSLGGFRIIKILGEGGMGLVFLAEDTSLNRKLAIKVILPTHANQTTKERFFREARATAALHHENVIAIFQVGEDNGVPFLAMPFLQGQPLDNYLAEQKKLSVKEALRITMEALAGLSSAHARSMIHRDIKPSNIWLEGARKKVILLDFGLAKGGSTDNVSLTRVGAIMGTPAYMSPEQAQAKEVDRRADLFSMGVVLYEMLTGEGPFKGKTVMAVLANLMSKNPKPPSEVDPGIPQEVSDICMWMLEKDLEKRPKSAREVAVRIQAIEKAKEKSQAVTVMPEPPASAKTLPPTPAKTLQGNPVKTQDGQWQPKNIEELSKLYPETDAPRPKPSGEMPRKKKKKKSSQVPVFMGLGGVLFFIVGLAFFLLRNEPISIEPPKKQNPIALQTKMEKNRFVPDEGFNPLFPVDGIPDGWVSKILNVIDKEKSPPDWLVEGGELRSAIDSCNWLITNKEYGNFILKFEIKLAEDADSGVLFRHPYPQKNERPFELYLNGGKKDRKFPSASQSGAVASIIPPKNKVVLDREWNEVWIKFEGTHFEAKINEEIVQDLDYGPENKEVGSQAELIRKLAITPLKGHLGFQCNVSGGEPIRFRNVQIKELNQTQSPTTQEPYEIMLAKGNTVVTRIKEITRAKEFGEWVKVGNESIKNKCERAFKQAPKIHYDLSHFKDIVAYAKVGSEKGWTSGNYDNAALHMLISRPEFLRKTVFYKDGLAIPSPFSEKQVDDSGKKTETLGAQEPKLRAKLQHTGIVQSLAFSGDGKVLASGAGGGKGATIKLWDVASKKETATLSDKEIVNSEKEGFGILEFNSLAVSQNGKWIAARGLFSLSLWDVSNTNPTGLFLHSGKDNLIPHMGEMGFSFNNDSTLLAVAYADGKIRLLDVETKKEKAQLTAFKGNLKAYKEAMVSNFPIAFSPDNVQMAASFSFNYGLKFAPNPRDPLGLLKSDLGNLKSFNGPIQLLDAKTGKEMRILKAKTNDLFSDTHCLGFSGDGKLLISGGIGGLRVWDLSTGNEQPAWEAVPREPVTSLAISSDGKVLITAFPGKSVKLWKLKTGNKRYEINHQFPEVKESQKIALSPDGKTLAIAQSTASLADPSEITLWDLPAVETAPKE